MRINQNEIKAINSTAKSCFGLGTKVYLFGSRSDDRLKGGDIDLFITNNNNNLTLIAKIKFLAELKSIIGEQKIDVVLDTLTVRQKKGFYQSVTKQAIKL